MDEIIRQAVFNCRSAYNLIHGPEVWLALAKLCGRLAIFDAGVLAGMWLSALLGANGRDDDDR